MNKILDSKNERIVESPLGKTKADKLAHYLNVSKGVLNE